MIIVVDIGNSFLKMAHWDGQKLGGHIRVQHRGVPASELRASLKGFEGETNDGVYVASVANQGVEQEFASWLALSGHGKPVFLKSTEQAGDVRNAYKQPATLGVDRWCAMIAARAQHDGPLCVVDAGTAMTVDWISADGRHNGGLIMPGPTLQSESLLSGTARVHGGSGTPISLFADNTAQAVEAGACYSCAALLEKAVSTIQASESQAPRVFVTGGEAKRIMPLLSAPAIMQEDLVLRGVARLADEDRFRD